MPQAPSVPSFRRLPALGLLLATFAAFLLVPISARAQTPSPSESPSPADRPVLGILGLTAPDNRGVAVARVLPDSGAEEGGLQTGDLIVDLEGNAISSMDDLTAAMERFRPEDEVTITYERDGERRTAEIELGSSRNQRRASPFEIIPDPGIPDRPGQPELPESQQPTSGPDYRPVVTLFGLLITGALIALIVLLARKNRPVADAPVQTAAYAPLTGSAGLADPLEVLRLRYAKGEISRDEYLTMSADLNGGPTPPSESPTKEL